MPLSAPAPPPAAAPAHCSRARARAGALLHVLPVPGSRAAAPVPVPLPLFPCRSPCSRPAALPAGDAVLPAQGKRAAPERLSARSRSLQELPPSVPPWSSRTAGRPWPAAARWGLWMCPAPGNGGGGERPPCWLRRAARRRPLFRGAAGIAPRPPLRRRGRARAAAWQVPTGLSPSAG